MKSYFVETKYKGKVKLPRELRDIKCRVAVFTTAQFIDQIEDLRSQVKGKVYRPEHAFYEGQVLGCSLEKFDADAIIYVGDGEFHPSALAYRNDIPLYVFNPFSGRWYEFDRTKVENMRKRQKAALAKFHSAKNIGVLISVKPGQYDKPLWLKEKYPDKNFYFFVMNNFDNSEKDNYPFIDVFINSMCPRIADDSFLLNISELLSQ